MVERSSPEAGTTMFIGIDVSKDRLDVAVRGSELSFSVAYDEPGLTELVKRLTDEGKPIKLVVVEATGGYEREVATTLMVAGIPLAIVNPRQVRHFAKATGRLAKTDAIDASILAFFAEAIQPAAHAIPDEVTVLLDALVTRRRQLVLMLAAEKNRRAGLLIQRTPNKTVLKNIDKHIAWLEKQVDDLACEGRPSSRSVRHWARDGGYATQRCTRARHAQPKADRVSRRPSALQS
jgi:transposase